MAIALDEADVLRRLAPRLESERFREGIANLTGERFFLAFFLASVSQGEALGEQGVALIGQEELAQRIRDLKRQEAAEREHKERTLIAARQLLPEFFSRGRYRHAASLDGEPYYLAILEANRARLLDRGRDSRLNLYLTTTFAYETMVLLLYRTVADAIARSRMPEAIRRRVALLLDSILGGRKVGILEQHNTLLEVPRQELSAEAAAMLDRLSLLEADDYWFTAELAVVKVVELVERYADGDAWRARIESGEKVA